MEFRQRFDDGRTGAVDKRREILEEIHAFQVEAFLYWRGDVQSKPLNAEMGHEATNLHEEIVSVLNYIMSLENDTAHLQSLS